MGEPAKAPGAAWAICACMIVPSGVVSEANGGYSAVVGMTGSADAAATLTVPQDFRVRSMIPDRARSWTACRNRSYPHSGRTVAERSMTFHPRDRTVTARSTAYSMVMDRNNVCRWNPSHGDARSVAKKPGAVDRGRVGAERADPK